MRSRTDDVIEVEGLTVTYDIAPTPLKFDYHHVHLAGECV